MSIIVNDGSIGPIHAEVTLRKQMPLASPPLVDALRRLVADTITVAMHSHGFHWNVKGPDFTEYHLLFGAIYEDVNESVDPTAENLLKLGMDAPYNLTDLVSLRSIPDVQTTTDPASMSAVLLGCVEMLLASLNATLAQAMAANEQGIANFLADRVDQTQKWAWQLRASIGQA